MLKGKALSTEEKLELLQQELDLITELYEYLIICRNFIP